MISASQSCEILWAIKHATGGSWQTLTGPSLLPNFYASLRFRFRLPFQAYYRPFWFVTVSCTASGPASKERPAMLWFLHMWLFFSLSISLSLLFFSVAKTLVAVYANICILSVCLCLSVCVFVCIYIYVCLSVCVYMCRCMITVSSVRGCVCNLILTSILFYQALPIVWFIVNLVYILAKIIFFSLTYFGKLFFYNYYIMVSTCIKLLFSYFKWVLICCNKVFSTVTKFLVLLLKSALHLFLLCFS